VPFKPPDTHKYQNSSPQHFQLRFQAKPPDAHGDHDQKVFVSNNFQTDLSFKSKRLVVLNQILAASQHHQQFEAFIEVVVN